MEKLRFKKGDSVLVLGNGDIAILDNYELTSKPKKSNAQILIFAKDKKSLEAHFSKVLGKIADNAVLWIAYPKKTGTIKSDISRDNGWDIISNAGYDPVTQISIDETWSALRFKNSNEIKTKLRDIPMSQRQTEGIDYSNRTVQLPIDAEKALKQAGLLQFFNLMSFSHKKEYVESIVGAKKEETRIRRIEKTIAMVSELKAKKAKNEL